MTEPVRPSAIIGPDHRRYVFDGVGYVERPLTRGDMDDDYGQGVDSLRLLIQSMTI